MMQPINPAKLKAAAEHLEWVLMQYPESDEARGMLHGLLPLINAATEEKISQPLEHIPFEFSFADGLYRPYVDPNIEDAYVTFKIELRGGLTESEKILLEDTIQVRITPQAVSLAERTNP